MKNPLSIAVITLNEEKRLAECLASVSFADDIVVVDSGSTDSTLDIARRFGARVYRQKWQGFGRQKQTAIDHCKNRWVLILDADERLSEDAMAEIKALQEKGGSCAAYQLPRKNFFLGRWIRYAGWWPDYVTRLINKERCRMSANLVHESIEVNGLLGQLDSPIIHQATRNLEHTMEKMDRYSTAGAREMHARGESASYAKALGRGVWAFFYNYFIRRGFLDGGPGFIIAVSDAVNKFFKYAKLAEMDVTKF